MMRRGDQQCDGLQPSEPTVLFAILLAARVVGDRILEAVAQDRLLEFHIRVILDENYQPSLPEEGT